MKVALFQAHDERREVPNSATCFIGEDTKQKKQDAQNKLVTKSEAII